MNLKSKQNLFLVERHINGSSQGVPIAIFLNEESADNYAAACEQDFLDRKINEYVFRTHLVSYYHE